MDARRRLFLALVALVGVFLVGSGGYMVVEGASFSDAAFMTLITLSTVGYDQAVPLSNAGRTWTAAVIVFGIGVVSVAFTSLLTLFVGGEIRTALGRSRLQHRIDQLSGHTVLCGFGRMGAMTAQMLKEHGQDVVVIDQQTEAADQAEAAGLLCVVGDAIEESTLRRAGITRAGSLVAAMPSDAANVFVALTARGMSPSLRIVCRAEQPATEPKLLRAGANQVICPQVIGATRIAHVLTRPHVVEVLEVASKGVDLELDEYLVQPGSVLCDQSLRDSRIRQKTGAMVVSVKRADGTSIFQPGPDEVIREGDRLILIGRPGTSNRLGELNPGEPRGP